MTIRAVLAAAIALVATSSAAQPIQAALVGGGAVAIARDGDAWRVTVTGPRSGLASLCVADETRLRILHASAAVGEGVYVRDGGSWTLQSGFDFKLRDRRQGGGPADSERGDYFATMGWVANADNSGTQPREFLIRATDAIRYLGVTFLTTSEPMAVSYWPETMDDDCRAVKIAQGYLAPAAAFRPDRWHPLK